MEKMPLPDEVLDMVSGGVLTLDGQAVDGMSFSMMMNGDVRIEVHTAKGYFRHTISPPAGESWNVFDHWQKRLSSVKEDDSISYSLDNFGYEEISDPSFRVARTY